MENFIKFLQKAKTAINKIEDYSLIRLVLGNESCDLDSTISALALSFLLYCENENSLVIPIMNVNCHYFKLRTETCYLLKNCGIDPAILIYKDQIEYPAILKKRTVQTSLVDHHVLSENDKILEQTVVQIFDHRPINHEEIVNTENLKKTIKIVGSCATLITNEIITVKPEILFPELSHLLYTTIIYDTIGLDKNCGRTFDEDLKVASQLENILHPRQSRKELFDSLWKVHNDTSTLSTEDLLYRDVKIVQGIPIPGLPLLAQDYLKRDDADTAIEKFANDCKSHSVILIGIDASVTVRRDIAIYSTYEKFRNVLITILTTGKGAELTLKEISCGNKNITCFSQENIKLTRKFILPLLNEAGKSVLT